MTIETLATEIQNLYLNFPTLPLATIETYCVQCGYTMFQVHQHITEKMYA